MGFLVGLVLAACEQPTESSPTLLRADASAAALSYSTDRAAFLAQFPGLPVEDFEAGTVDAGGEIGCPGPLDATSDNACFRPGGIKTGISFNSDHRSGQDETGQELALLGAGFAGVAPSKQLVATFDVDAFLIDFTPGVTAVGMDLVSYANDNCQVTIFGASNALLGSTTAPCTNQGTFWGVSSAEPISRIEIYSPTNQFEGADNIAFGQATVHVPPVAKAGGPYTGVEGSPVTFDGSASSDPGGAALTYHWDFGDGTPPGTGATPSHTYADNGTYTVTLTVSNGTLTGSASATALIANAAPLVAALTGLPVDPVGVGTVVTATAAFTDAGVLDTHTGTVDWGDGTSSPATVTEANGSGQATASHSYAAAGVYTVILTVTDNDGASGHSVFEFVVVFDPAAGFVTGGGWIESPPGAYTPDPSLTGKATFGFVSRYLQGASAPSGNTEFQFHAGGLDFSSTSYDWLVVAGSKVQFKGSGTINGAGDFGFLLSAVDGGLKGGPDTFRIKIWDKVSGNVIYDNNMGNGNGAPATTELGGGSIVIHQ